MGQKHLIECHCVLSLYKNRHPPVYHKFIVYSKFDNKGHIIPKYVNCNNCGITHYVYELCKSDIKIGKEDISSVRTIKDIEYSIPDVLVKLLKENECSIEVYEEIEDTLENESFPKQIIIKKSFIDDSYHNKYLVLSGKDSFKVHNDIYETSLIKK